MAYVRQLQTELARFRDLYRWVPISERMPEKYGTYVLRIRSIITREVKRVMVFYQPPNPWDWKEVCGRDWVVMQWMLLPDEPEDKT